MFRREEHILRSDIFTCGEVRHGFATRNGGVSVIPAVASMNTAVRMGDTPENVAKNVELLAEYAGLAGCPVVYSRQIHSANVLRVTPDDTKTDPEDREWDGYVTDCRGIGLLVRAADCVPILFAGVKEDLSPVIGAAHAGWKGTALGIAAEVVEKMCRMGAVRSSIRVAVGPSIHSCCFEVKEDFVLSVTEMAGADFAARHISRTDGRFFASLQGMNLEILEGAGIPRENIDISDDCTAHMSDVYHSHRATAGNRGTGGGIIGIAEN